MHEIKITKIQPIFILVSPHQNSWSNIKVFWLIPSPALQPRFLEEKPFHRKVPRQLWFGSPVTRPLRPPPSPLEPTKMINHLAYLSEKQLELQFKIKKKKRN